MPYIGPVVYPLRTGSEESLDRIDTGYIGLWGYHHQIFMLLERIERLRSQRVALHHPDLNGQGPRLSTEDIYQELAAVLIHVDFGQTVKPLGGAFVDGIVFRVGGFNHIPERGESIGGERCYI